ncbi:hypothetical protein RFM99_15750 [Mesorhizobium sp. VK4C]|uniref:hypothetical protein n=1 Tax=Mesorhizobium captivum TaxID=3072319 RepID=UPI002A245FA6|nr:hypothetical protein [Mesorhizobium sp. VK4C]MDX8499873.1 hypothetical protein [Mesorhizobium sp. VK4C]
MRIIMLLIAVAACFYLWDHYANDGRYTGDVERSFRQAAADLPTGGGPPVITFNRNLLKH